MAERYATEFAAQKGLAERRANIIDSMYNKAKCNDAERVKKMSKDVKISLSIDKNENAEVSSIFEENGMDVVAGIKLYLRQVQLTRRIAPFTELQRAIDEAENQEFDGSYNSIESFEKAMNCNAK